MRILYDYNGMTEELLGNGKGIDRKRIEAFLDQRGCDLLSGIDNGFSGFMGLHLF